VGSDTNITQLSIDKRFKMKKGGKGKEQEKRRSRVGCFSRK